MKHLLLLLMLTFSIHAFSHAENAFSDNPAASVDYDTGAPETDVISPLKPLDGVFETFVALVAFIPIVVQFLRKLVIPNVTGLGAQLFSWAIGIAITMAGWLLHLGFLDGLSIWLALLYGAGACLAANGLFDTGIITAIFGLFIKKPQET